MKAMLFVTPSGEYRITRDVAVYLTDTFIGYVTLMVEPTQKTVVKEAHCSGWYSPDAGKNMRRLVFEIPSNARNPKVTFEIEENE